MLRLKTAGWMCLLTCWIGVCRADVRQLQSLFQSILSEQDETRLPSADVLALKIQENVIQAGSADEIQLLLTLGQKCLYSRKPLVLKAGMQLFLVVSLRPDSSELFESYVDDVALLLDNPDWGVRNWAIYILGSTNPSPSSKALSYLDSHLEDNSNDATAVRMIAGPLLAARGASIVHRVLTLVEKRHNGGLTGAVIQMLGVDQIATDEALKFIHEGLRDSSAVNRRVSVDAVDNLPEDFRRGFTQDLERLIGNPDEDPKVSQRAQQVLLK